MQRLELDEGKLSRPVLRGGSGSNATSLPDLNVFPFFAAPLRLRSSLAVGGKQGMGNAPALRRHGQHAQLRSHSDDAGALTAWGLPTRNAP
jgi:hypothetical protein